MNYKKLDYKMIIISFKKALTVAEENELKNKYYKKGFTFGKQEENDYYFIKYYHNK